ncbi:MAG: hypothetical protein DRP79_10035 [Planctomycetota bacterium]|nr:MAG: hypothetical protein DRP79_10035 [Planctomycetota bacterium]
MKSLRAEILKNVDSLPTLPVVTVRLCRLLNDPEVTLDKLGETIKYDPGLTAKLLRMANSAYFGSARNVATLKEALVRLGISRVYRLVIGSSVQPLLSKALEGYDLEVGALWRHSVGVGVAAEEIELLLKNKGNDLAFTAGLLHDIGKLVLGSFVKHYFESIEEKVERTGLSFEAAEKEVLGIDHTEAGSAVLKHWGFPEELVTVIKWHHEPSRAVDNQYLVDLVHIADMIAMMMGIGLGSDGLQYRPSADSMSRLGLDTTGVDLVAYRTIKNVEKILQMFENNS